jgi:hypothetical protein
MLNPEAPEPRDITPFDNGVIETLKEGEVPLDFLQQEPTSDYSDLVREAESNVFGDERALRADYSEIWRSYGIPGMPGIKKEEISKAFDAALPGSILCDLGGYNGKTEDVAASHDASLYINVDRYPRGLNDDTAVDPQKGHFEKRDYVVQGQTLIKGIHNVMSVRADMLDFVSRLRDNSVNITINGIDADIIPTEKYHESLATEILRATKHQGVIFGHMSYPLLGDVMKLIKQNPELSNEFRIVYNDKGTVVISRK